MNDTTWMDLMRIGKSKPAPSNCPRVLSAEVKKEWPELIRQNHSVIAGMDFETSWNFALSTVFHETSGLGMEWIDPKYSGRPAMEKFSLDVTARRALTVAIVDTTKALSSLTIGKISRSVDFSSDTIILTTTAEAKLAKGVSESEWLSNLVKNRFKVFGYTYTLFGLPSGSTITLENRPMGGILYTSETRLPCNYIPADSVTPLINPEIFARIITNKIWLPAIRKFKHKSTKRKNSLL